MIYYSIEVNHNLSINEMVLAGNYDWNQHIIPSRWDKFTKSDKFQKKSTVGIEKLFITFFRGIDLQASSLQEFNDLLSALGYRPANIEEVLAFGAQYPDIQKNSPVLSIINDEVVCLGHDGFGRFVRCYKFASWIFDEYYTFLVINK